MNEIYYPPEEIAQCTQAKTVTKTIRKNVQLISAETDNWQTQSN
jgi:hypothetical protein